MIRNSIKAFHVTDVLSLLSLSALSLFLFSYVSASLALSHLYSLSFSFSLSLCWAALSRRSLVSVLLKCQLPQTYETGTEWPRPCLNLRRLCVYVSKSCSIRAWYCPFSHSSQIPEGQIARQIDSRRQTDLKSLHYFLRLKFQSPTVLHGLYCNRKCWQILRWIVDHKCQLGLLYYLSIVSSCHLPWLGNLCMQEDVGNQKKEKKTCQNVVCSFLLLVSLLTDCVYL